MDFFVQARRKAQAIPVGLVKPFNKACAEKAVFSPPFSSRTRQKQKLSGRGGEILKAKLKIFLSVQGEVHR
ncbi:MAG TPA: hypothetical protein IAB11_00425 [Candidatus Ornithoclostridium faecavium]|nr:hypothetical protein [Candidatus Ornithoclostridium faecavium]